MHPKNDKFLVWARAHYGWEIERMRGLDAGELALFVSFFITDRFVLGKKPTYAYEIAWVFQRDRGTIGNVLRKLEGRGVIVRTNASPRRGLTLFLPKLEDAKDLFEWVKSDHSKDPEDFVSLRKYHDENCPCRTLRYWS